jgi:hypothetical protein
MTPRTVEAVQQTVALLERRHDHLTALAADMRHGDARALLEDAAASCERHARILRARLVTRMRTAA